ncbi:MAG: helix-turn-helix transcriptional regulator [Lachnospiraceae bacterium]|nr:helix-turn-helix transcriptional regulator [Lachnospiraceae bacterium]
MLFSERLRELRQNKGLSQSQLADALNISKSAISMYELGKREPDLETLEGIADFFNVDINYLIGKEDGSMYYLDPEAAEIAQEVQQRPELKILFDASRKVSAGDLELVINMIDRLKKNEGK